MKKFYFILFFLPLFGWSQNQWQFSMYTGTLSPFKSQMPKMSTVYGGGFGLSYKPSAFIPVSIDWSSNFGLYYSRTMKETYVFNSSSQTTTDVTYTSKMREHLLGAKIDFTNDYAAFRPYIKPQIGWATMKSKILIADPNDTDDCHPLDKKTNSVDRGFVYGGEIGMQVDMNKLFKNVQEGNRHYLFVSASYLRGFNQFEYINQKYMTTEDHDAMPMGSNGSTSTDGDGRDVTASFVNVTTNEIHEHKIAELYKTNLEMWGIKVGYVIYF